MDCVASKRSSFEGPTAGMKAESEEIEFNFLWQKLAPVMMKTIKCSAVEHRIWVRSFEHIYSICFCSNSQLIRKLYKQIEKNLQLHVEGLCKEVMKGSSGKSPANRLRLYSERWKTYHNGAEFLNQLFLHLNKSLKRIKVIQKPYNDSIAASAKTVNSQRFPVASNAHTAVAPVMDYENVSIARASAVVSPKPARHPPLPSPRNLVTTSVRNPVVPSFRNPVIPSARHSISVRQSLEPSLRNLVATSAMHPDTALVVQSASNTAGASVAHPTGPSITHPEVTTPVGSVTHSATEPIEQPLTLLDALPVTATRNKLEESRHDNLSQTIINNAELTAATRSTSVTSELFAGQMGDAKCSASAKRILEVYELALDAWKKSMINPLNGTLLEIILKEIENDRRGKIVAKPIMKGAIESLKIVDRQLFYGALFEKAHLEATDAYYQQEASKLLEERNCFIFMQKVLQRLEEERRRNCDYLDESSHDKVLAILHIRLTRDHLEYLYNEIKTMLDAEQITDLGNLFKLLLPVSGAMERLIDEFQKHVKSLASQIVDDLKNNNDMPTYFVESLLRIYNQYSQIVESYFQKDIRFFEVIDKAFIAAVNVNDPKKQWRTPDLVARYSHDLLSRRSKGISDAEIDTKLSKSLIIMNYLTEKDAYEQSYLKYLARRLTYDTSQSIDAEESIHGRLVDTNLEFTAKISRMLKDVKLSADLTNEFQATNPTIGINMSIKILQTSNWPISRSDTFGIILPPVLERCITAYDSFYQTKFNGRKLFWLHSLGTADLSVYYEDKKQSFITNVSTFHAIILLQFAEHQTRSVRDLVESTLIPEPELIRQLDALVKGKLLKVEYGGEIYSSSNLVVCLKSANKKRKINPTAVTKTAASLENDESLFNNERQYVLQAIIVRIMKVRKVLKHPELCKEVIEGVRSRFLPTPKMMKTVIEFLIHKEYLERTEGVHNEYNYKA